MLIGGIVGGLLAASGQSAGYLLSRRYLAAGGDSIALWIRAQVVMGTLAVLPLALTWRPPAATIGDVARGMGFAVVGYLGAQLLLFIALRRIAGSRVAPLLGIKIPILAGLVWLQTGIGLSLQQWAAVGLAVFAMVAICRSGTRIGWAGLGLILAVASSYALSDLGCNMVLRSYGEAVPFTGVLWAACSMHLIGALILAPFLMVAARRDDLPFRACVPYAATWTLALIALFTAFAWVGVIAGVILQSLRSPLSVLMGFAIARRGHLHLEEALTRATLLRQVAAACLMVVATVVFLTG